MNSRFVILISATLYLISMVLPGIFYLENNPKFGLCSSALEGNFKCIKYTNGYSCSKIESGKLADPKVMSKQEVDIYCGQDWDAPVFQAYYGYSILLLGWAGILVLNFAWFGNPLFLIALIATRNKNFKDALIASVVAFLFGLTAFMLRSLPNLDTKGPDVDHLGVGYYVWVAAIAFLAVNSYWNFKKQREDIDLSKNL